MADCFLFLENEFPDIYSDALYCEVSLVNNFYQISIICAGMCCEKIISLIYESVLSESEIDSTDMQLEKLKKLQNRDIFPQDILDKLHSIRQFRNKAVHGKPIYSIINETKKTHHFLVDICQWFYISYNGYDLETLPYKGPIYVSNTNEDEKLVEFKPILEDYVKKTTDEVIKSIDDYFKQSLNGMETNIKNTICTLAF